MDEIVFRTLREKTNQQFNHSWSQNYCTGFCDLEIEEELWERVNKDIIETNI